MSVSSFRITLTTTLTVLGSLAFTKGITCLSRYGDEMYLFATSEYLMLSATNTAETSYCRFQYSRMYFSRYHLGQTGSNRPSGSQEPDSVSGQLLTKVSQSLPMQEITNKDD